MRHVKSRATAPSPIGPQMGHPGHEHWRQHRQQERPEQRQAARNTRRPCPRRRERRAAGGPGHNALAVSKQQQGKIDRHQHDSTQHTPRTTLHSLARSLSSTHWTPLVPETHGWLSKGPLVSETLSSQRQEGSQRLSLWHLYQDSTCQVIGQDRIEDTPIHHTFYAVHTHGQQKTLHD